MKKFKKNLKYITFSFVLIVAGFAFAHRASAGSYTFNCSDGGNITFNGNIAPTGPFTAGSGATFIASGQAVSTCLPRTINMSAQNNTDLPIVSLIGNTSFGPGTYPFPLPASVTFAAPSSPGTSYMVTFITGVYEDAGLAYIGGGPSGTPVQGGTQDTNIVCSAALSGPSVSGDTVTFIYNYNNSNPFPNTGPNGSGSCSVPIPPGQSTASDYPGLEFLGLGQYNIVVTSYCFDQSNSTVINSSTAPSC